VEHWSTCRTHQNFEIKHKAKTDNTTKEQGDINVPPLTNESPFVGAIVGVGDESSLVGAMVGARDARAEQPIAVQVDSALQCALLSPQ